MAICNQCGTDLLKGAKVCDRCGCPVKYSPQSERPLSRRSSGDNTMDPSDRVLLRVLSVFFAISFILFCAGIGGRIYIGRVVDCADNGITPEFEYNQSEYKSYFIKETAAIARADARVYVNTIRDLANKILEDDEWETDFSMETADIKETEELLQSTNTTGRENFGIRYILFQCAGYYIISMWIFGILSVFLLAFWFMKGGRFSNIKDTASPAAYIMILGVALLAVYCFISPDFSEVI